MNKTELYFIFSSIVMLLFHDNGCLTHERYIDIEHDLFLNDDEMQLLEKVKDKVIKYRKAIDREFFSGGCAVCGEKPVINNHFHCRECGAPLCQSHVIRGFYLSVSEYCPDCFRMSKFKYHTVI